MEEVRAGMSEIEDQRHPSYVKYPLADILIIVMCAVLCGLDMPGGLVIYAKNKKDFLAKELLLTRCAANGKPAAELYTAMALAREHWKIESVHWLLDVTFSEDDCRLLSENAHRTMNALRKFALALHKNFLAAYHKKSSIVRSRYFFE